MHSTNLPSYDIHKYIMFSVYYRWTKMELLPVHLFKIPAGFLLVIAVF